MCPVMLLTAVTGVRLSWSGPSTWRSADASMRSFRRVPVPCALTWPTSSGSRPASASAPRIARTAPAPVGSGAVAWWASVVAA